MYQYIYFLQEVDHEEFVINLELLIDLSICSQDLLMPGKKVLTLIMILVSDTNN